MADSKGHSELPAQWAQLNPSRESPAWAAHTVGTVGGMRDAAPQGLQPMQWGQEGALCLTPLSKSLGFGGEVPFWATPAVHGLRRPPSHPSALGTQGTAPLPFPVRAQGHP